MSVLIELAALFATFGLLPVWCARAASQGRVGAPAFMRGEVTHGRDRALGLGFLVREGAPRLKPMISAFRFPSPEGEGSHPCRAPDRIACRPYGTWGIWLPFTRDFRPGLQIVSFLRDAANGIHANGSNEWGTRSPPRQLKPEWGTERVYAAG